MVCLQRKKTMMTKTTLHRDGLRRVVSVRVTVEAWLVRVMQQEGHGRRIDSQIALVPPVGELAVGSCRPHRREGVQRPSSWLPQTDAGPCPLCLSVRRD